MRKRIEGVAERLLVTSLVFSVILVFIQVIMRYCFDYSLSWSEELARYVFIWQTWLGASLGFKYGKHIRVEIIKTLVNPKLNKVVDLITLILCLVMTLFLALNGSKLISMLLARKQLSPAMRIPMGYLYSAVPVGCALMTIRIIQQMYKLTVAPEGREE